MGFERLHVAGMLANFGDFMHSCETADPKQESTYLDGYLEWWIERGDAIQLSGGNYGTYMLAVVLIVDKYAALLADPAWRERAGVEGIFNPEELEKGLPDCLSREYWEQIVYQRSHSLPVYLP